MRGRYTLPLEEKWHGASRDERVFFVLIPLPPPQAAVPFPHWEGCHSGYLFAAGASPRPTVNWLPCGTVKTVPCGEQFGPLA